VDESSLLFIFEIVACIRSFLCENADRSFGTPKFPRFLPQLSNERECRAVLVTGLGPTFCQGVDLTVLTYDSADRQRRAAEHLAGAIKKLVTTLRISILGLKFTDKFSYKVFGQISGFKFSD
jgi:hypothetical protein